MGGGNSKEDQEKAEKDENKARKEKEKEQHELRKAEKEAQERQRKEWEAHIENLRKDQTRALEQQIKQLQQQHMDEMERLRIEGKERQQRDIELQDRRHREAEELMKKIDELNQDEWPLPDEFPSDMKLNNQEKRTASTCYRTAGIDKPWDKLHGHTDTVAKIRSTLIQPFQANKMRTGALISGPPGCGKTLLVEGIIKDTMAHHLEFISDSEQYTERAKHIFSLAKKLERAIIVVSNIDLLFHRQSLTPSLRTEFISLWDDIVRQKRQIMVIGTCSKPDAVHSNIRERMALRFDVSLPNDTTRTEIMKQMLGVWATSDDLKHIVDSTMRFSYNDLTKIANAFDEAFPESTRCRSDQVLRTDYILQKVKATREAKMSAGLCHPELSSDIELTEEEEELAVALLVNKSKHTTSLKDIGGLKEQVNRIQTLLKNQTFIPGILLHGPTGCGKTMLATAIAKDMDMHFIHLKQCNFQDINKRNADTFFSLARKLEPCIIFIDEIDVIIGCNSDQNMRASFQTHMDGFDTEKTNKTVVLGATNHLNHLDEAVLRRFPEKIEIKKPETEDRKHIIYDLLKNSAYEREPHIDIDELASDTHDFSGSDLFNVIQDAGIAASETESKIITFELVKNAVKHRRTTNAMTKDEKSVAASFLIDKSTLRTTWGSIGGLHDQLSSIKRLVSILCADKGGTGAVTSAPRGMLLHGPSGCGKTMIANAIAAEKALYFLDVNAGQILGNQSTALNRIQAVFSLAIRQQPSVIFLDEIGTLMGKTEEKTSLRDQFADQMNRLTSGKMQKVQVVGTTNRLDRIDPDFKSLFDTHVYIGHPGEDSRREIVQKFLHDHVKTDKVFLQTFAKNSEGCTGRDLRSLYATAKSTWDISKEEGIEQLMSAALEKFLQDKKERLPAGLPVHVQFTSDEKIIAADIVDPSTVSTSLDQIVGLQGTINRIDTKVVKPLTSVAQSDTQILHGMMIVGPPGCGKTMTVRSLAKSSGVKLINLQVATMERIESIRALFSLAEKLAPVIIFIDKIDSFLKDKSKAIFKLDFLQCWADVKQNNRRVVVVGASNVPDKIDEDILGGFQAKLTASIPDEQNRRLILKELLKEKQHDGNDINSITKLTDGYSGRQLNNLIFNAEQEAKECSRDTLTLGDFEVAVDLQV